MWLAGAPIHPAFQDWKHLYPFFLPLSHCWHPTNLQKPPSLVSESVSNLFTSFHSFTYLLISRPRMGVQLRTVCYTSGGRAIRVVVYLEGAPCGVLSSACTDHCRYSPLLSIGQSDFSKDKSNHPPPLCLEHFIALSIDEFARAAITKYHSLAGFNNRFSHSSWGWKSKIKVSAELSSETFLFPWLLDCCPHPVSSHGLPAVCLNLLLWGYQSHWLGLTLITPV